jgi:hypothetical protein
MRMSDSDRAALRKARNESRILWGALAISVYVMVGLIPAMMAKNAMPATNNPKFVAYYTALWPWHILAANVPAIPGPPIPSWVFDFN